GITGSGQTFGYDQRHWLTHVSHLAKRKHGTGRVVPRRTVTIDQRNHAGHVAEAICPNVFSGSHEQHTRHAPRRGCVDALDMRVRHGRAQHETMRHSRKDYVVRVAASPGDKTQIFMTPHGLTDTEFHATSSPQFIGYRLVSIVEHNVMPLGLTSQKPG